MVEHPPAMQEMQGNPVWSLEKIPPGRSPGEGNGDHRQGSLVANLHGITESGMTEHTGPYQGDTLKIINLAYMILISLFISIFSTNSFFKLPFDLIGAVCGVHLHKTYRY